MEKANIFALKSLFRGVAFFVLGFTVFSSSAYSSQKVTFACNPFPPQKIDSGNPKNQGFDVELLREVLTRGQKESEFVFAPWKRAYQRAVKGKVSGLCSCSYRADRKKDFLFSQEVGKVFVGIFVPREKSNGPMAIEDFEGKTVGVVRGYNLEAELHDKNIRHIEANSERNLALMLSAGRLDAVYSFRDTFLYYANEEGLSQSFEFIKLRQSPYYVCLSKAAPKGEELKSIIDSGLESLRADGTYRKLRQKYFPAEAK